MCEQLLANPLIESYEIKLEPRERDASRTRAIAVVCFPGSNDDRDARLGARRLGAEAVRVWHAEDALPGRDCGRRAPGRVLVRRLPALRRDRALLAGDARSRRVRRRRRHGARDLQRVPDPLRGRLLPGVLRPNESLAFVCRDVASSSSETDTRVHDAVHGGQTLTIPVKHGEGAGSPTPSCYAELEALGQIVLRYAAGANPNGSVADVAGVCNAEGNVLGLMPHPEHAVDPLLGSGDGALVLAALVDAARSWAPALV